MLLPIFVLAHFSHHLVAALVQPLFPFIRESFALDYTKAGILVSAFNLSYGICQLPGGWLAGRFGFPAMMAVGISGVSLTGILIGVSPGFLMIVVVLVFMGILGGGYHPSASPLISSVVEEKYRGRVLGVHQIGGTASFFLVPIIAVAIAREVGWRGTFLSLSVPTLAFGFFVFYFLSRRTSQGKSAYKSGIGRSGDAAEDDKKAHAAGLIPVIALNVFVQIFIYSTLSFAALFVVDHYGGSKETAAFMFSLAHSAGLWAGPLGGLLSDRIGKIPVLLFSGIIAGPLLLLLNQASLGLSLSAVLLLSGMAMYLSMPVTESYVITHTPERTRSTVLGIYYLASRGGPGLMAPLLGYIIDRYRFAAAFTFSGAGMLLAAIVCGTLLLFRWRNNR